MIFNFAPHSRDALSRATAVAGHAFAWILDFELFEVGGLGRAASPRPPSWVNKVGYAALVYVLFRLEKN